MSLSPAAAPPRTQASSAGLPAVKRGLRSLIKTRIVLMVMVATALGYWAAAGSFRPLGTLAAALAGTALASAGAGVLNNVLERHVDARMVRTRERALPQGSVAPSAAAWFGVTLTAGGAGLLAWRAGLEPALLSLLAAALYLFVYTPLKPRTWLNTPLGAIPGAVPPLIGGSAATGGAPDAGAWIVFAMLFLWQHPHFYAIAWTCRDDYRRAGLRMATEVGEGGRFMTVQVIGSLLLLIPVSLLLAAVGAAGVWYAAGAAAAGAAYLAAGIRFARRLDLPGSRLLLRMSVLYLPAILLLSIADRFLRSL